MKCVVHSACLLNVAILVAFPQDLPSHWYRGNTHTHTINSDGDSTPDDVVRWYREHGYDFLFLTDHGMITDVDPLNALFGGGGQFLVLRGEEVTSNFGDIRVHVNSLNPKQHAPAMKGDSARDTLQKDLDAVQDAGGLTQINHPNFFWQLSAEDIASVHGAQLMEIRNMHPIVNSLGAGPGAPSTEEMWDQVLTRGVRIWGVASDDEHQLKQSGSSAVGTAGAGAFPGQGWIMVHAAQLTPENIMTSLANGDFYASTGIELESYEATTKSIKLRVRARTQYQTKYRVEFIGEGGRVLQDAIGESASYEIRGTEKYVRARITDSNGKHAWTQPVFLKP